MPSCFYREDVLTYELFKFIAYSPFLCLLVSVYLSPDSLFPLSVDLLTFRGYTLALVFIFSNHLVHFHCESGPLVKVAQAVVCRRHIAVSLCCYLAQGITEPTWAGLMEEEKELPLYSESSKRTDSAGIMRLTFQWLSVFLFHLSLCWFEISTHWRQALKGTEL